MLARGPTLTKGSLLEGRYRVDGVIGAGGFGVVHAGWHLVLDCPVAIKVLALSDDDVADRAGRLLDEARVLSRLRHPGIVRVLDAGFTEPAPGARLSAWLVMEWCGERTLAMELHERRGERRAPVAVWKVMRPLVDAVAAAHAAGVAHRDIKPSNIMIVDDASGGGAARLIDFGIAKRVTTPLASGNAATDGFRAHTPAYAAPEQLAGTRSGPWTDVHALGLVLTEMLVGQRAYGEAVDAGALVDPVRPTPGALGVDVGAWEPVLARALSLKSAARYPDAAALRAALDEALPEARGEVVQPAAPNGALSAPETAGSATLRAGATLPDVTGSMAPGTQRDSAPAASDTTRNATRTRQPSPPSRPALGRTTPVAAWLTGWGLAALFGITSLAFLYLALRRDSATVAETAVPPAAVPSAAANATATAVAAATEPAASLIPTSSAVVTGAASSPRRRAVPAPSTVAPPAAPSGVAPSPAAPAASARPTLY